MPHASSHPGRNSGFVRPQTVMFVTSKSGQRFTPRLLPFFDQRTSSYSTSRNFGAYDVDGVMDISESSVSRRQTILGFGGAWTDAVAINVYKMDERIQEEILDAYYGANGLQYTAARVPIGGSDFSEYVYSYNDHSPDDFQMVNFSIDVDLPPLSRKIPFIQRALAKSERNITVLASTWAPPAWMTVENSTFECHIRGYPDGTSPYWTASSLYFSKFLTAYQKQGIQVHAVTVVNEPIRHGFDSPFQAIRMNSTVLRDFVKYELGPRLRADHPHVMIVIGDDQKPPLEYYTAPTLDDPEAAQYVDGVAFHWYMNFEFVLPGAGNFDTLARHHTRYPDKFLIRTEACEGTLPLLGAGKGIRLTNNKDMWQRAENYARDILGDLQNHAVGWMDWNIVLDTNGGPNWSWNSADAPIFVNTVNGTEFYKQAMYYIMGHFSKYITPGSVYVQLQMKQSDARVESAAFITPEGHAAIVMQNRNPIPRKFRFLLQHGNSTALISRWVNGTLEANSVATLLLLNVTTGPTV